MCLHLGTDHNHVLLWSGAGMFVSIRFQSEIQHVHFWSLKEGANHLFLEAKQTSNLPIGNTLSFKVQTSQDEVLERHRMSLRRRSVHKSLLLKCGDY